jgi:hypothetical protein
MGIVYEIDVGYESTQSNQGCFRGYTQYTAIRRMPASDFLEPRNAHILNS